jgi:hypothetical protein
LFNVTLVEFCASFTTIWDPMPVLRRYTNLAAAIHMLQTKKITLLNPATWDDRNDAYFMSEYKRQKKAKTVLALCFTKQSETYHHWRVFSNGTDGVCIEFEMDRLLSAFGGGPTIKTGPMKYRLIKELGKRGEIKLEELPFLKRSPYKDEQEFRVVYVSIKNAVEFKDYDVDVAWIRRITLSPWMSKPLAASVKGNLTSIEGCKRLKVSHSTLVDNETWKSFAANVRT